jgi:hypothetical protein
MPESRKLELNAYLTKPTTRLARYPLLLEAVLKHTPEDSPDRVMLPQVVAQVREFLSRVNEESGRAENRFNLAQLDSQLIFKPGEQVVRVFLFYSHLVAVLTYLFCGDAGFAAAGRRARDGVQGRAEQARWGGAGVSV